jgi:hypothetical protein
MRRIEIVRQAVFPLAAGLSGWLLLYYTWSHSHTAHPGSRILAIRAGFSQRYHSEDLLVFIAAGNGSNDSFITRALCLCADELNSGAFH